MPTTTGVTTADEVIKYLLVGADVVMTTSALLRHGVAHMTVLLRDLEAWLSARQFSSVPQMRGLMSRQRLPEAPAFERANYIKIVQSYQR